MIHYQDESVTIYHGDCLEVLKSLPDNSVDSICTDPPYELAFMSRQWDASGIAFNVALWEQCLRVLKPGGHLLAFGGSRTWHRLAAAIEDAGFEIRDSIAWLYGSGFPKSLDVSKAIDKRRDDANDVRIVCRWLRTQINEHPGHTIRSIAEQFGFHPRMVEHWAARDTDSQPTLPTVEQWARLTELLGLDDSMTSEVYRLNGRKGEFGEDFQAREITGTVEQWDDRTNYALKTRDGLRRDRPTTDAAKQWQGWGTALKPAFEPIVVARKPLRSTVAGNVLEHGTGAINIDACRVGTDGGGNSCLGGDACHCGTNKVFGATKHPVRRGGDFGRWPTNVLLDDSQAAELDRQSGTTTSRRSELTSTPGGIYGGGKGLPSHTGVYGFDDAGGASRFFPTFRYTAKASSAERPTAYIPTCECENPWPTTSPKRATGATATPESSSTSKSGNDTTGGPSPTDTRSTTSTSTSSTTTPATCSPSPQPNTSDSTPVANSVTASGSSPASCAANSNPLTQSTGTSAAKDGHSTGAADRATSRRWSKTSVCGECGVPARPESHATVKPLELMRWLVRLVTPPGGIVLEPFAGSGTTVEACLREGKRCIAIERDDTYLQLIVNRIDQTQLGFDIGA